MTDEDIIHAVKLYKADWVVLTGGEPSLWIDADFVRLLKKSTGKKIAIETNGTHVIPDNIDWITVSPKDGIAGCGSAPVVIDHADEIKVVNVGQDLDGYFNLRCRKDKTLMYLQPCFVPDEGQFEANRLDTVKRVLADPRWTLSVQLHRYLNIP